MSKVESAPSHNVATLDMLSSWQLVKGGGYIAGPMIVKVAGSSDAVISLYDGTSTSGSLIAVRNIGKTGPIGISNAAFAKGLFVQMTGTTAATVQVFFTGNAVVI